MAKMDLSEWEKPAVYRGPATYTEEERKTFVSRPVGRGGLPAGTSPTDFVKKLPGGTRQKQQPESLRRLLGGT